jgi:hypothetical protein
VPREESLYRVRAQKEWVITGYTGRLLVDPRTAVLARFSVRTEELPAATNLCETETKMEYGIVQLGGGDYLLPKATRQRFIGRDGSESENSLAFSACREYQAESKLTFGAGLEAAGATRGGAPEAWDLPTGLPVTMELMSTIQGDQAAAGDPIEGRLAKPIRDQRQQKILAPEGAKVEGRLMRVEIRHSHPAQFTVALRWETIVVDGVKMPFSVLPNRRAAADPGKAGAGGLRRRGFEIELPLPGEGRYGVFHFSGEGAVMQSGYRTEWLTAKPLTAKP